jgi:hypothetical protein
MKRKAFFGHLFSDNQQANKSFLQGNSDEKAEAAGWFAERLEDYSKLDELLNSADRETKIAAIKVLPFTPEYLGTDASGFLKLEEKLSPFYKEKDNQISDLIDAILNQRSPKVPIGQGIGDTRYEEIVRQQNQQKSTIARYYRSLLHI